jgi:hypothetical protein
LPYKTGTSRTETITYLSGAGKDADELREEGDNVRVRTL